MQFTSFDRLRNLSSMIMTQMAAIEKLHGKMFSEIDAVFEQEIFDALDSKNMARINDVIKRLDDMS
jgi:hypothetical protein